MGLRCVGTSGFVDDLIFSRIERAFTMRYCYSQPAAVRPSGFCDPMRLGDFIDFISVERESTIGVRAVNTLLTTTHCL